MTTSSWSPHSAGAAAPVTGSLVVDCSYNRLAVPFPAGTIPAVDVNGTPVSFQWGQTVVQLPAGNYHVRARTRSRWIEKSAAQLPVVVHPGQTVVVYYRPSLIIWLSGALGFTPQRTPGARLLVWSQVVIWTLWLIIWFAWVRH